MSFLVNAGTYRTFAAQCAQCGHCAAACPSLTSAKMTLGDIAQALLAHDRAADSAAALAQAIFDDKNLIQAVRGCYFCSSCRQNCFADNDVFALIYAARTDFNRLGLIPRLAYSSVMVDEEWDIFTAYRAIHGIGYADLTRHIATDDAPAQTDCDVAFFPGCSLAAYGPELTREVFATVEQLGGKTTMIDHCCGSPLKSAGFYDRALALCDRIADEIAASGAKQVVCVCPGCRNALEATLSQRGMDVPAVNLSHFLLERGFQAPAVPGDRELCFSKSCQDCDGTYLDELALLLGLELPASAVFEGCCGAGGAVGSYVWDMPDAQTERKLSRVPAGAAFVSACPTCTYTYASYLMAHPMDVQNVHYLELLFENRFDWDTVFDQLQSMWTGEYGPWLNSIFVD